MFEQSIAADPNYALAYAGLAETYNVIPSYRAGITSRQAASLADAATRKALELDDSLPEAHLARADFLSFSWKWAEAEQEYRRAIELDPNSATAHYLYAFGLLVPQKKFDQAVEEFRLALSLDPLSPIVNTNYAATLMDAHRYPEALAQFQKTLERDPAFPPSPSQTVATVCRDGRLPNAVIELKKFAGVSGTFSGDAKGFRDLALSAFRKPDEITWVALALSVTGEPKRSLDYLEKALSNQEIEVVLCIRYPSFDPIRSDPRYKALVARMACRSKLCPAWLLLSEASVMTSRVLRLAALLLSLGGGANFSQAPASPVVTIRSAPERPVIEVRGGNEFLNFEMLVRNASGLTLRISQIELSAYDSAHDLVLRKSINTDAFAPSIALIGKQILAPGETLDVFNPFSEFESSPPLTELRYSFCLLRESNDQQRERQSA